MSHAILDLEMIDLTISPAMGTLIVIHKQMAINGPPLVMIDLPRMLRESPSFLKLEQLLTHPPGP